MPGLRKQIQRTVLDDYRAVMDKSADKSLGAELRAGRERAAEQVAGQRDGGTKNRFDGARG
jgi:hypothetical protein